MSWGAEASGRVDGRVDARVETGDDASMGLIMMPRKVRSNPGRSRSGFNVFTAGLLVGSLLSCGPRAEPKTPVKPQVRAPVKQAWPEGAVLAMGSAVIGRDELERTADWIAHIKPGLARNAHRRLAFTGLLLERAALANAFAEPRAEQLQAAEAFAERARAGDASAIAAHARTVRGYWSDVGLAAWGVALDLEPGTWSAPFEDTGRWLVQRLVQRLPGAGPADAQLELELAVFDFTPPGYAREDLVRTLANTKLTTIDAELGGLVPATWRYTITNGN